MTNKNLIVGTGGNFPVGGQTVMPQAKNFTPTNRDVLAKALCNATNGGNIWGVISRESQVYWRHQADKVIGELATQDWIFVPLDDVRDDR